MKWILPSLIALVPMAIQVSAAPAPMEVTAREPAKIWTQGYGVGNGRLGALSYGEFPSEILVLNEESIFAKQPVKPREGAAEALKEARELCARGDYKKAEETFRKKIHMNQPVSGSYQQGGLLDVHWQDLPPSTSFSRKLDMKHGKARMDVRFSDGALKTELIAAPRTDCIAYRVTCSRPGGCTLTLTLRHPDKKSVITPSKDGWTLRGQGHNGGTRFENTVQVQVLDGKGSMDNGVFKADHCRELLVLSSTKTDYNSRKPDTPLKNDLEALNRNILEAASKAGWKKLEQETAGYFSERMMRCQVDIGDTPAGIAGKTTPERIELVKQGGKDPDLVEQLFQFGRYCILANTRPGALPCGLQGLWNPELNAAWRGCFFLNINCQMNQWPTDITGLGEYHRPFLDFVLSLQPSGEQFARFLKLDGFCFAHNVDCWKNTYFSGSAPESASSLMNGAWACAHLMDSYRFTGDREFLRKCLPLLESNARFIMSWFQKDKKGRYISGPATSPENVFRVQDETGKKVSLSISNGCSHDLLLGRESLRHYILACRELGVSTPTLARARQFLPRIPQPAIGKDGRIMEWQEPFEEAQKGHRHISHLYGLFPGNEWDILNTPKYAAAVKASADYRRRFAGKSGIRTGWSTAWLINMYATLGCGNDAEERIYTLLKHYINPNLFDMHPPYQIDGNFGMTSGLAQCLIQSQIEQNGYRVILLAPALADSWAEGSATGLRTRGGLTVDLSWKNGRIAAAATASRPGKFRFMHQGKKKDMVLKTGDKVHISFQPPYPNTAGK